MSANAAINVTAIAVTTIPNPGDFFWVVPTGVAEVGGIVAGIVVAAGVGVPVSTAVVWEVLGIVVITVVGVSVTWIMGEVVGTLTSIKGLRSWFAKLVFVLSVLPITP